VLCFDPSSQALARFERIYSSPSVRQYITAGIFVAACDEFGGRWILNGVAEVMWLRPSFERSF